MNDLNNSEEQIPFDEYHTPTSLAKDEQALYDTPFFSAEKNAEGNFSKDEEGNIKVVPIEAAKPAKDFLSKLKNRWHSNGINNLLNASQSHKEKIVTRLIGILVFFITAYVSILVMVKVHYMTLPYKVQIDYSPFNVLCRFYQQYDIGMNLVIFAISIMMTYMVVVCYVRHNSLVADHGVVRSKNGTYGNSDWLNNDKRELKKTFDIVEDVSKPVNVPLGIYKDKLYCMPLNPKHNQFKNQNICVLGGSGSGKSFSTVEPFVMQRIAYGQSFLVTDTKGDICRKYYRLAEKWGFEVKVFNTIDFFNSCAWNCLQDIVEASEAQVYYYVDIYATTIIKNSSQGKEEVFWPTNEQDLLRSILHLVCRSPSYEGRRTFTEVIRLVNSSIEEILRALNAENEDSSASIASASIRNNKNISLLERFRSGLANRLQVFRTPEVCAVLSYDDIQFSEICKKKTAIFLITDSEKEAYDSITSLFITMLYNKLIEIANSPLYGGSLKVPFWIITDELCNMAAIMNLSRIISTNRSRKINFVLAIQSLSQLDKKYEGLAGNILSNCGTTYYFGNNDPMTTEYITQRAGSYTIKTRGESQEKPTIAPKLSLSLFKNVRTQEAKKTLIEISDSDQMQSGEVIVFVSGKKPCKLEAYTAPHHALYRYCEEISIDNLKPKWVEQYKLDNPGFEIPEPIIYHPSEYELNPTAPRFELDHDGNPCADRKIGKDSINIIKQKFKDKSSANAPQLQGQLNTGPDTYVSEKVYTSDLSKSSGVHADRSLELNTSEGVDIDQQEFSDNEDEMRRAASQNAQKALLNAVKKNSEMKKLVHEKKQEDKPRSQEPSGEESPVNRGFTEDLSNGGDITYDYDEFF